MKSKRSILPLLVSCFLFQTCDKTTEVEEIDSLSRGLMAHYPFNGNADDASGNGNHGIVVGATLVPDRLDQDNSAYLFDGVDDYIDLGNETMLKPVLPVTIAAWIKRIGAGNHILRINYSDTFRAGIWIGFEPMDEWLCVAYGDGGWMGDEDPWYIKYTEAARAGSWFHLAATISESNTIEIYLNGTKYEGAYSGSADSLYYDNGPVYIGKDFVLLDDPPLYFSGLLDDLRLYDRVLSAQEIEDLYLRK